MITIKTNNHWNTFLYGYELPEHIKVDFDYLGDDLDTALFIKYKGTYYDFGEFMDCTHAFGLSDWQGYHSDSFFSGILIRTSSDCEQYQIATYYSEYITHTHKKQSN